jgi:SAM-dependent methyltransferase
MDTLEHVEYPRRAMQELQRILQDGGIAIVSSVMNFPIHGYPNDYWRFTPEGMRSLLEVFDHRFVGCCGSNRAFPQTIVGIGFKGSRPVLDDFEQAYARWELRNNKMMQALALQIT